jgi:hypothetical protein
MDRRLDRWQDDRGDRRWLSLLVDAMEYAARPEIRSTPCDAAILQACRAQLMRPVSHHPYGASIFSLRN